MTIDLVPFPKERYADVLAELLAAHDEFWDGRDLRALHTAVWFRQFADRALLAMDGQVIVGYLCGTVTADALGYVHLVAVRRGYRRRGIARDLWATFTAGARRAGAVRLEAVTSPGNADSIAFHTRQGMSAREIPGYAADGQTTVLFRRELRPPSDYYEVERDLMVRNEAPRLADTVHVRALLRELGDPQEKFSAIHLTGTDGKTTTTRVADSLLRAAGVRAGRFTTPHIEEVRERFGIDGQVISKADFVSQYKKIRAIADRYEPGLAPRMLTYFELLVPMAYDYYASNGIMAAAVEVGIGGGTDGTNVLQAPVCVLTSMSLDHTNVFGPTIGHIAREKVGIIHPGATVISAAQPPDAVRIIRQRCDDMDATLLLYGEDFAVSSREVVDGGQRFSLRTPTAAYDDLFLPLHGAYQADNSALAIVAVAELLRRRDLGTLDVAAVRAGLAAVTSPNRLEPVCTDPLTYFETAHNPAGMKVLAETLRADLRLDRVVLVLGLYPDRDPRQMVESVRPGVDAIVVMTIPGAPADALHEFAAIAGETIGHENTVEATDPADAMAKATAFLHAAPADRAAIVVTGVAGWRGVRGYLRAEGLLLRDNATDRELDRV